MFDYGAITLCGLVFQPCSTPYLHTMSWSYNPSNALTILVWALSRSLATTCEISIDLFSSAYLDVSVRQVGTLCDRYTVGFPHSEIYGSKVISTSP
jgi:hypothetical protein